MTHTPGPWEPRRLLADGYLIKKEGWEIRTPSYDVATWIERGAPIRKEADARLLAAAPDLLAACEDLIASIAEDWPPPDWDDNHLLLIQATAGDIRRARAAIAAAEAANRT